MTGKQLLCLSTNVLLSKVPHIVQRRKNGCNIHIEKPHADDVYTANMGGVDQADQLHSFYSTGYSSRKWYRYIFWFLFSLSVCNGFIHESIFHTSHGKRKCLMISFILDLEKKLINGFSQRKRRQRSQEAQSRSVAREEHKSVHAEGRKRKCVQ